MTSLVPTVENGPSGVRLNKTYKYITTWEQFNQALLSLNEHVKKYGPRPSLALDVETYWTDGRKNSTSAPRPIKVKGIYEGQCKTIQIGYPSDIEDFQWIFDVELLEDGDIHKRRIIGDALRPILEDAIIFGQELKYEFQFMYALYNIRLRYFRDVKFINQVLNAGHKGMKSRLSVLYDEYLDPHFFKEYTGMYQSAYDDFKHRMQLSNWRGELTEEQLQYAAHDVSKLIFQLYHEMTEGHEEKSIDAFIEKYERNNKYGQTVTNPIKLEWRIIPIFAMMELRGICYDLDYHNGFVTPFLTSKTKEASDYLYTIFPPKEVVRGKGRGKARVTYIEHENININAWQQMLPALEKVGINVPNFRAETLEKAYEEDSDNEILRNLIKYRKASSMLSKYANPMPTYVTAEGKIHVSAFQIGGDDGVATGRSTLTDPALMTIPNRDDLFGHGAGELFRKPFRAKPGYIFIDADYSQIEPRCMAYACQDEELLKIYNSDEDMDRHAMTARFMFDLDYTPTEDDDPYRKAGKEWNLGSAYGMGLEKGATKIRQATKGRINLTMDEMRQKRDNYNSKLKGLKRMRDKVTAHISKLPEYFGSLAPLWGRGKKICIQTEYGRPRNWTIDQMLNKADKEAAKACPSILDKNTPKGPGVFFNLYSNVLSKISRDAFNHAVGQGLCADIFKLALLYTQQALDEAGFDFENEGISLVVHDEILLEVKEERADEAEALLRGAMEKAFYEVLSGVKCKIGIKRGHDWHSAH